MRPLGDQSSLGGNLHEAKTSNVSKVGLEDTGVFRLPRWVSLQEIVSISLFLVICYREVRHNFLGEVTELGKSVLLRFQECFY